MLSNRILIYSDDSSIVNSIVRIARKSHIYASTISDFNKLSKNIKEKKCLAVILDYKTLNHSEEVLQRIKNISNKSFVILITSSRKYEGVLSGFEGRIFDIIRTPVKSGEIKRIVERLNYVKFIVRDLTRNMLEFAERPGKYRDSDSGIIENMPMEKIVMVKLQKVVEKLNLDNLKGFYDIVIEEVEKPMFHLILEKVNWNQIRAARILGISRNTLRKKLKQYSIRE